MAHSVNPAQLGWQSEGCNAQSKVEFWRSPDGVVKLDYYPTTGDDEV